MEQQNNSSILVKTLKAVGITLLVFIVAVIALGVIGNTMTSNIKDIVNNNSEHFYLRGAYDQAENTTVIHKEGNKLQLNLIKGKECDIDTVIIRFNFYDKNNNLVQTTESTYNDIKKLGVEEKMPVEVLDTNKSNAVKLEMSIIEVK